MLNHFVWFDWLIMLVIAVSTLISLKRGFFRESLSLVVWLLAFVIALLFYPDAMVYLEAHVPSPSLRKAAAIAGLFALTLLAGSFVVFVVAKLVDMTGLGGLDRLLGMVFGALRGVVIVVVLLMLGQAVLPLAQEQWWQQSVLIPHFLRLEGWVSLLMSELRGLLSQLLGLALTTR
ncbi:MAG TPA: CvpA family protein [Pseudomonadales bacterium]